VRAVGCRLVASDLPGVRALQPSLGSALSAVALPRVDLGRPHVDDLPAFALRLAGALVDALAAPDLPPRAEERAPYTWAAVFARIERAWDAARAQQAARRGSGP